MRAGDLDRIISILSATEVQDPVGDEVETWVAVLTDIPAGKRPVSANEVLRNPQITSEVDVIWTIRHPGVALNSKMRVEEDDGRLYEIRGINELPGRRVGFEILAVGLDKTGATTA